MANEAYVQPFGCIQPRLQLKPKASNDGDNNDDDDEDDEDDEDDDNGIQ